MAIRLLLLLLTLQPGGTQPGSEGQDGAPPPVDQRVFAQENQDMVSINMFKVYERYSKEPQSRRDGNTVRSFKAVPSECLLTRIHFWKNDSSIY